MTLTASLASLLGGERPCDLLLPPVRLFMGGAEYFGEEAVLHAFRREPLLLSADAEFLRAEGHLAIFDGPTAVFAGLYGDRIARLWCLRPGEPHRGEPAIGVPFDTDLRQARRDLAFRHEDHPTLGTEAAGDVEAIGYAIAHDANGAIGAPSSYRARPFAIAAFSDGDKGAALFAVHRLGPDPVRSSGFAFAAARFSHRDGDAASFTLVRDAAGEAAIEANPWRTRFA